MFPDRRAYLRPSKRKRTVKARDCPLPYTRYCGESMLLFTTFGLPLLVRLLKPKRHAREIVQGAELTFEV